jgi:L-cysteine S-thiosulfotransferase
MTRTAVLAAAFALLLGSGVAMAQTPANPAKADPALVDAYLKATFGKAPAEWQERIVPDETLATCNATHNEVSNAQAAAITQRELAKVMLPADGSFLGNWQEGQKIANSGQGGQFSDNDKTFRGGNCYACHQLDPKELSYGTLGPSLKAYGKDRKFSADDIKAAYIKIYNSQAVAACSNMPRFGASKFLNEQQIKDLVALLFDPQSPVNK